MEGGTLDERLALLLLYVVAGLLMAGLALPLILEKVGPNTFYGFRLPKAFKSREIWFAANRYGGRLLLRLAIFLIVVALALYDVPGLGPDAYVLLTGSAVLIALLVIILLTVLYIRSL